MTQKLSRLDERTWRKAVVRRSPPIIDKNRELVINLKAAKSIGLTIPQSVLFRADDVIR